MNKGLKGFTELAVQLFKRRPLYNSLLVSSLILGCGELAISDDTNARTALEQHNYSNIELLGPDFFNCKEIFGTRARVTSRIGSTKDVVVCRALSKPATILVLARPQL